MIPIVTRKPWGIACLVLSIFFPGSGALIAAGNAENKKWLVIGILQGVTALIIIGFPWSWVTGVMIFLKSEPPVEGVEIPKPLTKKDIAAELAADS